MKLWLQRFVTHPSQASLAWALNTFSHCSQSTGHQASAAGWVEKLAQD